jgi:trans-aconitate methyltransferase
VTTVAWNKEDILDHFRDWNLDAGGRDYLRFQGERYSWLLKAGRRAIRTLRRERPGQAVRILDIGPAYQTELMRRWDDAVVDTLGFLDERFRGREGERHHEFDLNDAQYPERWITVEPYDLVVMAEVIEHLYTSPRLVLACVASWMRPGGFVVVQTPNAVSLRRRLKLLAGRHPYEKIRDSRTNPGHFREYTARELSDAGRVAGLEVAACAVHNYFGHPGLAGRSYNSFCRYLPSFLRDGITIIYRRR